MGCRMTGKTTIHREAGTLGVGAMGSNRILPKRIILVRHGESQGNLDNAAYTTTADHRIPLTATGVRQAREAGAEIRRIVARSEEDWRVYFYVSPYTRTRATLSEIGRSFSQREIAGVREECRIREQDFGNFQEVEKMRADKKKRQRFGRFFFRFPEGESAADAYDRVTSFLESLWRDIDMNRINRGGISNFNIVIVSHGLTSRVFLMKWFRWTVEQFERLRNLTNCEVRVMQLSAGGEYSLAIHHSDEEMRRWGLSQDMITDQKMRATAKRGEWIDDCPRHFNDFFQHLRESDEADCLEEDQRDSLNLIGDRSLHQGQNQGGAAYVTALPEHFKKIILRKKYIFRKIKFFCCGPVRPEKNSGSSLA